MRTVTKRNAKVNPRNEKNTQRIKNVTSKEHKVIEMDNDTYALRRRVINVLYEVKRRGFTIPRIEVRVIDYVEGAVKTRCMAYAYINGSVIHILKDYVVKLSDNHLTRLVLHELVHTLTKFEHDSKCILMKPRTDITKEIEDIEPYWKVFREYIKQ